MTQTITVNQNKGSRGSGVIVVRATSNSGFISTSANAPTNFRANTAGETITEMRIAEVMWSCHNVSQDWTIKRGANTVLILHGPYGHLDFIASGMRVESNTEASANVVFTLSGSADGFIMIKLHKMSGA